jgi:hypothetical protein
MGCLVAVEPRTDRLLSMDCYRCPCAMMPRSILCGNGVVIVAPGRIVARAYSAAAGLSSIGSSSVCNTRNIRYHCRQWAIWYNSRRKVLRNAGSKNQRHGQIGCASLYYRRLDA